MRACCCLRTHRFATAQPHMHVSNIVKHASSSEPRTCAFGSEKHKARSACGLPDTTEQQAAAAAAECGCRIFEDQCMLFTSHPRRSAPLLLLPRLVPGPALAAAETGLHSGAWRTHNMHILKPGHCLLLFKCFLLPSFAVSNRLVLRCTFHLLMPIWSTCTHLHLLLWCLRWSALLSCAPQNLLPCVLHWPAALPAAAGPPAHHP